MSDITLRNVCKSYDKEHYAVKDFNLDIHDGEFVIFVGPSGCGKSTTLRMIAGLEEITGGELWIDKQLCNYIEPKDRDLSMVFQNYALYPQMTVYDNMASPLRSKLYKRDEEYIKKKITEVAEMMKMDYLLERLPSQLSNGQKQRVAMGRALVRSPRVYLMDEPLAHLDAKLRNSMRTELKEIQANFGTTSVYVTHDFMEAMSLGDRIAIINEGKVVQVGTGDEIYYMPCNEFVAELMGDPEINIITGAIKKAGDTYKFTLEANGKEYDLPHEDDLYAKLDELGLDRVDIGMRPQNLTYSFEPKEGYMKCSVYSYESIGNKAVIIADVEDGLQLRMIAPNGLTVKIDQDIYVDMKLDHAMFFDAETQEYLTRYREAAVKALAAEQEG